MPSSSPELSEQEEEKRLQQRSAAGTTIVSRLLRHFLPFAVCLLCIPVLLLLSGTAGWFVWKSVPIGWQVDAHLQYGEAMNPIAVASLPSILSDQPYDISLHLVLPATDSNYALGNFMTTLQITTAYNETITSVRRSSALAPPRPSLVKQVLLGTPSIIELDISLLYHFVAGTSHVTMRLELGRPDAWRSLGNGQSRELTVLAAVLTGAVRPTGIRAFLARYPRLTTFISSFTFFFISIIVVLIFIFSTIGGGSHKHEKNGDGSSVDDGSDGGSSGSPISKILRHRREGAASSSGRDDDVEPSTRRRTSVLRRRKSRLNSESARSTSHIKIETQEDSPLRHSAVYPKLPFLHEESSGSLDNPSDNHVQSKENPAT